MVKLHVKKGDESQFLFETTVQENIADLVKVLVAIYNGRLKVDRLYYGKFSFYIDFSTYTYILHIS